MYLHSIVNSRATLHDLLTAYPNFLFYGIDDFSGQVAASRLLDMDLAGMLMICRRSFILKSNGPQ